MPWDDGSDAHYLTAFECPQLAAQGLAWRVGGIGYPRGVPTALGRSRRDFNRMGHDGLMLNRTRKCNLCNTERVKRGLPIQMPGPRVPLGDPDSPTPRIMVCPYCDAEGPPEAYPPALIVVLEMTQGDPPC